MTQHYTDIDGDQLDALTQRVQDAAEHNLALSPEDCLLLLSALKTLAALQERLSDNDITLHKLRKLVGIVSSSEKITTLLGEKKTSNKKRGQKSTQSKKNKPKTSVKPKVTQHKLEEVKKGDTCPECQQGKLYKYEPATLLRITGQTPFVPEQHVMERLRCNACGQYFSAALPTDVLEDGEPGQKYGYSARSIMVLDKFYAGSPYYRQENKQALMGVHLTASTIFDQSEQLVNDVYPVFRALVAHAAQAEHYYLDDTSNRILDQDPIEKNRRNSDKVHLRSGVYSSGLISHVSEGHCIVLYQTNIGHAGEFIDELLSQRENTAPVPLLMTDALSHNRPSKKYSVEHCLCNSHGRRQFADVLHHFPDEVEMILQWYGKIWQYEEETKQQGLTPEKRLIYHQVHSLPIMEQIRDWGSKALETGTIEENSGLGKACKYFNKHYVGLTSFCRLQGAQLDNNAAERALKLVARNRKNAMFHKTQAGASIADVIMSLIASAAEAGINVFDYLNLLQRKRKEVKIDPNTFLPWNCSLG
ncbi:IS66 family transposase [Neptunomonas phycophila]|jgi:transposase|uniref:IS66 family transposase n=1 Tax=Neptunomonas phycophila TaxID=1572645 RepID=UPI0035150F0E